MKESTNNSFVGFWNILKTIGQVVMWLLIVYVVLSLLDENSRYTNDDLEYQITELTDQVDSLRAQIDYQNDYIALLQQKLKKNELRYGWYWTIPDYNSPLS